jgi:hypothetical protein
MKVDDYFVQGRRRWVRLHEKGGKEHDVPCHHRLDAAEKTGLPRDCFELHQISREEYERLKTL